MTKFLTMLLTAVLLAGVVCAQWLAVLPVAATLAHAPLHECSQHQCGCPAEMTARKACCCFHGETKPTSVVETLIRSVQCGGDAAPQTMTLAKLDWTMPVFERVIVATGLGNDVDELIQKCFARVVVPPVPPPRAFCA